MHNIAYDFRVISRMLKCTQGPPLEPQMYSDPGREAERSSQPCQASTRYLWGKAEEGRWVSLQVCS